MTDEAAILPDTNVFLHYRPLAEIDWCNLANSRSVILVICITVVHELDTKKSDPRLSTRAERAIREIREAAGMGRPIREGVTVAIYNRELRSTDFPDTLSPESADDRIVHLARLYATETPHSHVAIATGDYGMELRCQAGSVRVVPLPEALRLAAPQDETNKRLKQVQGELAALKSRMPKLELQIVRPGDSTPEASSVPFEVPVVWSAVDFEAEMAKARLEHRTSSKLRTDGGDLASIVSPFGRAVSNERWKKYDEELETFFKAYRNYLENLNIAESAKARCVSFDLWLRNGGSGLATDVDVLLRFPPNLRWVDLQGSKVAEFLREPLEPPTPPEIPSSLQGLGLGRERFAIPFGPEIAPHFRTEWDADTEVQRNDDGTHVLASHIRKLKHGHGVGLGPFFGVFGNSDDVKPFQVKYTVSAAEMPTSVEGAMPFLVRIAKGDSA